MHKSDPPTPPLSGYERRQTIRTKLKQAIDQVKEDHPDDLELIGDVLEGQRVNVVSEAEARKRSLAKQQRDKGETKNGSQPAQAK